MHPTNCLNCATLLTADDRFCPSCGQKTDTHRITMSHIWHDLVHAFTHTDKGFFYTIKELAIKPGRVAREYLEGRRKKYFNPFSFLIIIVGVVLIANTVFKPYSPPIDPKYQTPPPSLKTAAQKKKYMEIMERSRKFGEFMNKRTNIVLFISTPFIAAVLWLLFWRKRKYYAEHLSTLAYVNGFLNLLTIFIFGPLLFYARQAGGFMIIYAIMMISHVLYLAWMYYGFLRYTSKTSFLITLGAAIVAIAAWGALSMSVGMLYIRYGF